MISYYFQHMSDNLGGGGSNPRLEESSKADKGGITKEITRGSKLANN